MHMCIFLLLIYLNFFASASSNSTSTIRTIVSRNETQEELDLASLTDKDIKAKIIALSEFVNDLQDREVDPTNFILEDVKFNGTRFSSLSIVRRFFLTWGDATQTVQSTVVCNSCKIFIGFLFYQIRTNNVTEEGLTSTAVFTCRLFRLAIGEVCAGLLARLTPTFHFIATERPRLSHDTFCGLVLQLRGCYTEDPLLEWNIDPVKKPRQPKKIEKMSSFSNFLDYTNFNDEYYDDSTTDIQEPTIANTKTYKVLHLADPHLDPLYFVGSNARCTNFVLCCHEENGYPTSESEKAGPFGDNRKCDLSYDMLHLSLKHITEQHPDLKLVYMTGDLVPHNVWYATREDNTQIVANASQIISDYFPDTKVIPVLGNHDPDLVNLFSPEGVPEHLSTNWVYNTSYNEWEQWIPENQVKNFLQAGFYAVQISEKFRVLVINTNVCYGFNMWQLYHVRDPGGQLEWLKLELKDAEALGQTVHILGHVPPGHEDCARVWSREFNKLIIRHKSVVKGQFYGHTHFSEFRLLYNPYSNQSEAINTLWIAPSLTPYRILNPAYRIYHVSEETHDIIDHETWSYELDEANQTPDKEPNWKRLYLASEAFEIPNTLPQNMNRLVRKMAWNSTTFDIFYQFYKVSHTPLSECGIACRKFILCGIVQSYYGQEDECHEIEQVIDGSESI